MKIKRVISFLLMFSIMMSVLSLSSCVSNNTHRTRKKSKYTEREYEKDFPEYNKSLVNTVEKGVLTVYTNAEFPPFEYLDGQTPVGVDMQIAQAIADELGMKLEIKNVKFDTIITSVSSGKGDLGIAGITVTEERKEQVNFSINYATSTQYIVMKKDAKIEKIEDLAGLKIGVQLSHTL